MGCTRPKAKGKREDREVRMNGRKDMYQIAMWS
jgi:hypothetical protein